MARFRYRVLFLTSWYPHQGQPYNGIFVKRKAEAMKHRADVAVLFVVGVEGQRDRYRTEVVDDFGFPEWRIYYRRPSGWLGPFRFFFDRLRYLIACHKGLERVRAEYGRPDLVHLHVIHPAGYAALALKLLYGIPYVLTEHCDLILRVSRGLERLGPLSRLVMGLVVRQAEVIMVDSEAMRLAMERQGFGDAVVVWNIINHSDCPARTISKNRYLRLVHVSTLWDRQKNISGLLQSIAQATARLGDKKIILDIVGDGPDRERLVYLSRKLGLDKGTVVFHGRVDDRLKKRLLCRADCFVLSSRFEGFSVATAEALAAGLPVIVTDCGGPADFVRPENGLVIPVDDISALAEAIVWMSLNVGRFSRRDIARRARRDFDPQKVVDSTLAAYDRVPVRWTAGLSWERIKVESDWLVLDVGSGHNPNSRADVLLDRDLMPSVHRTGRRATVPKGKSMVVGDAVRLPFVDLAFDYAIASHVAEHVEEVEGLMAELARVARRGYLETPGPLTEYISNVPYHHWLVRRSGRKILFHRKKTSRLPSPWLFALFNLNDEIEGRQTFRTQNRWLILCHRLLTRLWKAIPSAYVRYHWEGKIDFEVRR